MSKALRIAGWVVGLLIVLPCIGSFGATWVLVLPVQLAVGWAMFLFRVLPEVSVRPAAVLEAVLVLAALGGGLHLFMRWLWPQLRTQEQGGSQPWPARWSVSILSLLVLLFLATMATVGIGHQVGWLASSREPLLERSLLFGFEEHREASELCDEALRLSKGGAADERIGGLLGAGLAGERCAIAGVAAHLHVHRQAFAGLLLGERRAGAEKQGGGCNAGRECSCCHHGIPPGC